MSRRKKTRYWQPNKGSNIRNKMDECAAKNIGLNTTVTDDYSDSEISDFIDHISQHSSLQVDNG
jgi:hypothetical protein